MENSVAENKKNGPIFIVGAPRSGTTLLQYMLRSHPRISLPTGESHFMMPLYRNRTSWGDLSGIGNVRAVLAEMYRRSSLFLDTDLHGIRFDIETLAKSVHDAGIITMEGIFQYLLESNARGEGKARWGDKTPYYVLHIPIILEMFPDAQIIHIIRDGRDCALSLFKRRHDFGVYNVYFAAKYWQQYVERGRQYGSILSPNTYMELRYEDLVGNPENELRRICSFLDEEFYDSLVNYKKSGERGKTPLLQQPVQSGNAEKWRHNMSHWQIRVFESAAGNALQENGYPVITSTERLPIIMRAFFRWHNSIAKWFYRRFRSILEQ